MNNILYGAIGVVWGFGIGYIVSRVIHNKEEKNMALRNAVVSQDGADDIGGFLRMARRKTEKDNEKYVQPEKEQPQMQAQQYSQPPQAPEMRQTMPQTLTVAEALEDIVDRTDELRTDLKSIIRFMQGKGLI